MMNRTRATCALFCFAALGTGCGDSMPPCPGLPETISSDWRFVPEGIDQAEWDEEIIGRMRRGCIPGLSVSVVTPEGERLAAAWGFVDVVAETPVTVDTPFMVASVSKAVDALAFLKAQEEGLLSLDSEVSDLVGFEVKNRRLGGGPTIEMRHLVTHSSGIQDNWDELDETYVDGDPTESLGSFLRSYLLPKGSTFSRRKNFFSWPAGREWYYSNVGAALAAHAIEEAAAQPYQDYTDERLFQPLELANTGWFLADFDDPELIARPHEITEEGWAVREHYGFATWPDGQLRTTASELGVLLRLGMNDGELDGERLLPPGTKEALTSEPVKGLSDWYIRPYVQKQYLFWFGMDLGDRWIIGHDGDDTGVSTEMFFDPKTNVGVVLLANIQDGSVDGRVREQTFAIEEKLFAWGGSL